jgi:dTDP-4-dehydrorhamnose 3,5-epimerase
MTKRMSGDEHAEISPSVPQDAATVDEHGRRLDVTIEGVVYHRLGPVHADHRGSLLEVIDVRDPFWIEPIVYAYRFTVLPGRIKGFAVHKLQADRYVSIAGRLRVVLFDGRRESATFEAINEIHFADDAPGFLRIPAGVWHADQNTGTTEAVILNFPTRPYDRESPDKYRTGPMTARSPSTGRFETARHQLA